MWIVRSLVVSAAAGLAVYWLSLPREGAEPPDAARGGRFVVGPVGSWRRLVGPVGSWRRVVGPVGSWRRLVRPAPSVPPPPPGAQSAPPFVAIPLEPEQEHPVRTRVLGAAAIVVVVVAAAALIALTVWALAHFSVERVNGYFRT